jgi:flagellar basal-body rod protein FlgC
MAIADIPILSMLRARLDWSQARQRVLAENVANSDTPRFHARDLAPLTFDESPLAASGGLTPVSLTRTETGHIEGVGLSQSPFRNGSSRTFRGAADRQRREPRGRDDESRRQPDGLSNGDSALHTEPCSYQNSARQALNALGTGMAALDFIKTLTIAASGLRAQAGRMRIISENIANADSTPQRPGADPYRRKIPTFRSELDRTLDTQLVELGKVQTDSSAFRIKYEPGHPSADSNGNVKYPNVNALIEMTDMREAQRSYEANINVIGATRRMIQRTIDILKA